MRTKLTARLATAAALAALALSPLSAAAQTADAPTEALDEATTPPRDAAFWPLMFDAIDTDGDGSISAEEFAAAMAELPPRMRGAMLQSLTEAEARREVRARAMIERLDTDGDGMISEAELLAGMTAAAEAREERRAEMQALRAERREARGAERPGRMQRHEMRRHGHDRGAPRQRYWQSPRSQN